MRNFILFVGLLGVLFFMASARAQDPEAKAQELAAAGKWADAIDAYGKFLATLQATEYRDKKDFGWLVDEVAKRGGDPGELKKAAADELTKHPTDNIFTWRLHRLLAQLAEKSGDADLRSKELDEAIAAYPSKIEGDPSKHSSLQHLYNERALIIAEKDLLAAEEYILKSFKEDKRFVYFFDHTWRQWSEEKGKQAEFRELAKKVLAAYEEKAKTNPSQRALLTRYSQQLRQSLQ